MRQANSRREPMSLRLKVFLGAGVVIAMSCALSVVADQIRYMDKAGNIIFVDKISDVPDVYRDQVIHPTPVPVLTKQQIAEMQKKQREQENELKRKEAEREKQQKKHQQEAERLRRQQLKEQSKNDPAKQLERVGPR